MRLVALFVCCVALAGPGLAALITVGEPADGYNGFPFAEPNLCPPDYQFCPGSRYQQAYSATVFPGSMWITAVIFPDAMSPDTLPVRGGTYTMSLSTISAGIDTLSTTDFDSNLGPDNTWFATDVLSGGMSAITFAGGPFFYDPSAGNLLVDIKITDAIPFAGGGGAYAARNGSAAGIFSRYHNFSVAGFVGYGLITEFSYEEVPEPGTLGLCLLAALLLFLAAGFRRRFGSRSQSSA